MKRVLIILMMVLVFAGCAKSGNPVQTGDEPVASPGRWTQTPSTLPIQGGRQETALSRVGCFQKMALEAEDGRTFIVQAEESAGIPGTVLRLAVYESVNTDKVWAGGAGDYAFAADTTIANGYGSDAINGLREWSADIRGDKIFIAFIFDPGAQYTVGFTRYDINTQTYISVAIPFVDSFATWQAFDYPVSVDIACQESGPLRSINKNDTGVGSIWVSFEDTTDFDPTITPNSFYDRFVEIILTVQETLAYARMLSVLNVDINANRGLMSIFDGGSEIFSIKSFMPTNISNEFKIGVFPDFIIPPITDPEGMQEYLYQSLDISGGTDISSILYDFGTWDACYIDFYSYQVQAKWIRAASGTGWDLYIGRRDQNGVFNAQLVKTVDYANIGLTNIETEAENLGTFPEVVLSTDEQGYVYCMFMFPDQTNNDLVGGALGDMNGNPYTNIEMVTMEGDQIYDPQNLDVQNVWNGFQDATYRSLQHMSCSHRTDSQDFDVPSDRRIWLTVRDNVGDTRIVLFRN